MKTSFEIQNLKCGGCANTISKKLQEIEDAKSIEINPEMNRVSFEHTHMETLNKVKAVLHAIGYPIVGDKNALITKAKSFVSCAIGRMN
ncbi:heavy-metal-associated domain-containing protein [Hyunsoonleella sp. SJ7]|uniref:Heavy-metal-associated domain-containing protein n=1 Tax=Hyunsoonleella aquatilis TaxID=2762758 RepID=A0A923HB55_9FLAO|nr:heavy-metal-associated domain-containing protein [Hyunsoonleella aquatilis]MBC3759244.1 heavy-metal-associated domain-containing protein [Hyunsoonleella aquatilis]